MNALRIGLPSKGSLHDSTIGFLEECGLNVRRKSNRHYIGEMGESAPARAIFLSASEICEKVASGTCDLGFTGVDLVRESASLLRNLVWLFEGLGYGRARLVLGVPESWRDVESLADVVELAAQWRLERGTKLRVATKFTNLTRRFLLDSGISDHALIRSSGATELSNWLKDADIISDLTSTGTTLSANRLKEIDGGTVLESEACLIGNRAAFATEPAKQKSVRALMGRIEARLKAKSTYILEASCKSGKSGKQGKDANLVEKWTAATYPAGKGVTEVRLHVPRKEIDTAIDVLRKLGLQDCRVTEPTFLYDREELAYNAMVERIKHGREES